MLVRGKVDHKDRDKTCLVAQQVERFEPTDARGAEAAACRLAKPARRPSALSLRLDATSLPATALGELKDLLSGFPGESDVVIELNTTIGTAAEARPRASGVSAAPASMPSSTPSSARDHARGPGRRAEALGAAELMTEKRIGRLTPIGVVVLALLVAGIVAVVVGSKPVQAVGLLVVIFVLLVLLVDLAPRTLAMRRHDRDRDRGGPGPR